MHSPTRFQALFLIISMNIGNLISGELRWRVDEIHVNVAYGYYDSYVELDCELTSPNVTVTFAKRQWGGGFAAITIDNMKYERVGNQRLKVNNLTTGDGTAFACQASGIKDKEIQVFVNKAPSKNDFHVILGASSHHFLPCQKQNSDVTVLCTAYGRGKATLYRRKGGDLKRLNVTEKADYDFGMVYMLTYEIAVAAKEDEGHYVCIHETVFGNFTKELFLPVDDSLPVIKSFQSKVVMEGKKAILRCKTDEKWPPERTTFLINGKKVNSFDARYTTRCNKLKINGARFPDDNGVITCLVQNRFGSNAKNVTLTVQVIPTIDRSKATIVEQNKPIECKLLRANPAANITWKVQPYCHTHLKVCNADESLWEDIDKNQFRIEYSVRGSTVFIPANLKRDFFFQCIASNAAGMDKHVVRFLYIRDAKHPVQIATGKAVFNEKEAIQLTCDCLPGVFSKLSWFKDDRNISNGAHVTTDRKHLYPLKSVLTIKSAKVADAGNYTCLGQGLRGETWSTTKVIQVKKIFAPLVSLGGKFEVNESDTVILTCNIKSNPIANVTWYKDGIKIQRLYLPGDADQCTSFLNGYFFAVSGEKGSSSQLIICGVNMQKNNGTFACNASNQEGYGISSASLNVLKKPSIEVRRIIHVKEGDSVSEICKAIGNPKPKVFWRLKTSGIRMSTQNDTISRLRISRISQKHFIEYECVAFNSLATSTATVKIQRMPSHFTVDSSQRQSNQSEKTTNLYILLSISFVLTLLLISFVFILMRRKKIYGGFYLFSQPPDPDYLRDIDPSRALIEQTNGLPYDPVWEFPRKKIRLLDQLGSGAFGDVHLAEAVGIVCFAPREKASMRQRPLLARKRTRSESTSSRTGSSDRRLVTNVAVKKLKENATPEEMRDLVSELKILIHIGEHSNIVNLLGACTKGGDKGLMIILEYAPHGNLLSFLKNRRQMLKITWKKDAVGMENELTTCDLALIAYQVAKGMSFLASRRCVHRDLAARNVLVGEGYVMKIADFGLARDVYKDDRYVKLSAGLLPIKWMAIEAIKERIFTHQSDVWSYGILLWEIMTMGGSPYPGLPVRDLLEALVSGYRMDKPIYCPQEIYGLMSDCWIDDPDDRPTFSEVACRCARIIEARLTPEESANFLDQEHFTGDGYLRPIESPRSLESSSLSPPPPYSAYINQKENKFFGSEPLIEEENSCRKINDPDVVSLETKRTCSVSEMKAKKDASQKEKIDSLSSTSPENESEDEAESTEAISNSPVFNERICFNKGSDTVDIYNCEKELDEVELQNRLLLGDHSYINHVRQARKNPYWNA